MSIPGTQGNQDGFDYQLDDIHCSSFTIGNSSVTSAPAPVGLDIALTDIRLACTADWSFKLHSWPHIPDGSGSVDIGVSDTSASLGVLVTAVALHAQLATHDVVLNVGSVDLTFHGSLLDWLLDLFKGYISDRVKSGLATALVAAVTSVVGGTINPALARVPMAIPLPAPPPFNTTVARFGLTDQPAFTAAYLAVDLQGDVVPAADQRDPPITPPALPPWTAANADCAVQLQLSAYTFESAVYAYYKEGALDWVVPPEDLPGGLNRTGGYAPIAPGFPAAFPGAAVELNVSFAALPNITFAPAGIAIAAPLALGFVAEPANGSAPVTAFTLLAATTFSGVVSARAANGTAPAALVAHIAYLQSNLSTLNSSVGPIQTAALQTFVDFVLGAIVVPAVNALMATGVPLPSFDGLTLVNPVVRYTNGSMTLGTNFTFTPPSELPAAPLNDALLLLPPPADTDAAAPPYDATEPAADTPPPPASPPLRTRKRRPASPKNPKSIA